MDGRSRGAVRASFEGEGGRRKVHGRVVSVEDRPSSKSIRLGTRRSRPHHGADQSALGAPRIHGELLRLGLDVSQGRAGYFPDPRVVRSAPIRVFSCFRLAS